MEASDPALAPFLALLKADIARQPGNAVLPLTIAALAIVWT